MNPCMVYSKFICLLQLNFIEDISLFIHNFRLLYPENPAKAF